MVADALGAAVLAGTSSGDGDGVVDNVTLVPCGPPRSYIFDLSGEEVKVQDSCRLPCTPSLHPGEGEFGFVTRWEAMGTEPLLARYGDAAIEMEPDGNVTISVENTYQGQLNMMGDGPTVAFDVSQWWSCRGEGGGLYKAVLNRSIRFRLPEPQDRRPPWVPPEFPQEGPACLAAGDEAIVSVQMQRPKGGKKPWPLKGSWRLGEEAPLAGTRVTSICRVNYSAPLWLCNYGAGVNPIAKSLRTYPGGVVRLVLRLDLDPARPLGPDELYAVCFVPGDGWNHYADICTVRFPVRATAKECSELVFDAARSGMKAFLLAPALAALFLAVPLAILVFLQYSRRAGSRTLTGEQCLELRAAY